MNDLDMLFQVWRDRVTQGANCGDFALGVNECVTIGCEKLVRFGNGPAHWKLSLFTVDDVAVRSFAVNHRTTAPVVREGRAYDSTPDTSDYPISRVTSPAQHSPNLADSFSCFPDT